jgi:outer membrane murein-binding lipoprotein Lpp
MSQDRTFTALAAAVLLSILSLGGCVTSAPMDARAEVPGPPKTAGYLAVEDVPPRPEKPAMTTDEQLKLKKELTTAHDRQAAKGKAKGDAARAEPVKP